MLFAIPPGERYTSLEKLFFPFGRNAWLCICGLLMFAVVILFVIKFTSKKTRNFIVGNSNQMPFFNMVVVGLGGSIHIHEMPMQNFARTMLLFWLLATLVLRNAYQGKLYDNLRRTQRKMPFFRLDDLFRSNLKLYIPRAYYQVISDNYPQYIHR